MLFKSHRVSVLIIIGMVVLSVFNVLTSWKLPCCAELPILASSVQSANNPQGLQTGQEKGNTSKTLDQETDDLLLDLKARLERYTGPRYDYTRDKCGKREARDRPCYDAGCPGQFSPSLRDRLKQVLTSRTPIPARYLHALTSAAQPVTSHKYIFVTGASSNHFYEMQLLVHTMHHSLFPRMKGENFTLVVYNLGLTDLEKNLTEKNCRCTVLDFPFSRLPDFITDLKCYAWKTLIVASLLEKAEYLTWLDASVRVRHSDPYPEMFRRARENGFQSRINYGSIAVRTREDMAHFFGDHLCQYSPFSEMEGNFFILYNDRFTREAFIKPWLSCAFSTNCMCIHNHGKYLNCSVGPYNRIYGRCHRFDQSGIGMIFSKLYLDKRPMLYVPGNIQISRDTTMNWFKSR